MRGKQELNAAGGSIARRKWTPASAHIVLSSVDDIMLVGVSAGVMLALYERANRVKSCCR